MCALCKCVLRFITVSQCGLQTTENIYFVIFNDLINSKSGQPPVWVLEISEIIKLKSQMRCASSSGPRYISKSRAACLPRAGVPPPSGFSTSLKHSFQTLVELGETP